MLERRLDGGAGWTVVGAGGTKGSKRGAGGGMRAGQYGVPFRQTEKSIGGVLIASVNSQKAWKSVLCQLVKNLEWTVSAGSSLCVS